MSSTSRLDEKEAIERLHEMQHEAFKYFIDKTNSRTGLVLDSTWKDSPSSIAAVGFGLTVLPVSVERGWISRDDAVERSIVTLRFFANSHQGPAIRVFTTIFSIQLVGNAHGIANSPQLILLF